MQAAVPADRLLVFDVKEGWAPLCAFLGVEVPDEPFPHDNAGMDTLRRLVRVQLWVRYGRVFVATAVAAIAAVSCVTLGLAQPHGG